MIFATDLGSPEGPVLLPDGSFLVVEMSLDRGWVARISADGRTKRVLARTGRPNGLAVDRLGRVWIAESLRPRLLRFSLAESDAGEVAVEEVATGGPGEPFLFPNDLAFGPDGYLYMTDSGIRWTDLDRRRSRQPRVPGERRWTDASTGSTRRRGEVVKLDTGIRFTNGIAFDAAGALYVNETVTGMVYRYRARLGGRRSGARRSGTSRTRRCRPAGAGPTG